MENVSTEKDAGGNLRVHIPSRIVYGLIFIISFAVVLGCSLPFVLFGQSHIDPAIAGYLRVFAIMGLFPLLGSGLLYIKTTRQGKPHEGSGQ